MLVSAGCGGAGDGGSSQAEEEQRASRSAEDSGDGWASKAKLGTPVLGSAEAPVVLTEYADYQ